MSELNTMNQEDSSEQFGNMTFAEMLDQSFVTLHTGDIVKGTVIQVVNEEISVNLGYKSDGVVPRGEYSNDTNVSVASEVKPGDEIEVYVVRVNDGDGNVQLSRKKVYAQKGMADVEAAFNNKDVVTGKVTEIVKGGLIAVVNDVRVFVPSSQVSNRFVADLNSFKGQDLQLNILEFDRQKRRIIGGRKELAQKEVEVVREKLYSQIEVGSKLKGKVSRITDFGAFVDLGGVDGLIHISEMSWGVVKHPKNILQEGQDVYVTVLNINKEKGKISLSLKDIANDPWNSDAQKYAVGSIVTGKVVRMVPFGAFVELEPGIDGLIHISQIANKHVVKPEDELTVGQEVEVKILDVNKEQKKISLSKREAEVSEDVESNETAPTEE